MTEIDKILQTYAVYLEVDGSTDGTAPAPPLGTGLRQVLLGFGAIGTILLVLSIVIPAIARLWEILAPEAM